MIESPDLLTAAAAWPAQDVLFYRKVAVSRHCLKRQCAVGAAPPISVRIIDAFIRCAAAVIQRVYPPPRDAR